ncbi:MAG: LamG-like jellyroll fold domain-containing protein [Planctomycetota bacterium]
MRVSRCGLIPCVLVVAALSSPVLRAQGVPLWRVDANGTVEIPGGGVPTHVVSERVGDVVLEKDVIRFERAGGKLTFPARAGFGIDDKRSFTLSMDLRTTSSAFATPLMCREGSAVHYSFVIGRHPGTIAFEPWCWARARAESVTRIDDGAWHHVVGVYDGDAHRIAIVCDGVLEADVAVPAGFAGSAAPGLRFGDNLDPGVRQAFVGELKDPGLTLGVPMDLVDQRARIADATVFPADEVAAMLSLWNDARRVRRAPSAKGVDDWTTQASHVRALVQDACGLWPPPGAGLRLAGGESPGTSDANLSPTDFAKFHPMPALDVIEGGRIEHDDWSVTRIYWQTFPGHHASGWLYLPVGDVPDHSRAAVLCPHGHWGGGATHPVVQKRCITLARAGYVVLAVDSSHVEDTRIGLAPLSVMTWSNLRGLELLRSRADVDPMRIGCTGASGGGQQTYYLTALDTGLAAAVPAVMACHFHEILGTDGPHCHCNHTPFLAQWTDMPIMAACFAPTPELFLTVTGDWTHEFPERGFPEVAAIYDLFGARDRVGVLQWNKGHDYDRPMRNAMYAFFARHLRGETAPDPELEKEEAPAEDPARLLALERNDVARDPAAIVAEFTSRLCRPVPTAADIGRSDFVETVRRRFARLFAHEAVPARAPVREATPAGEGHGFEKWVVPADGEVSLPALIARPAGPLVQGCVVLIHPRGKQVATTAHAGLLTRLHDEGFVVVLADVRYTGELDGGRNWRDLHGRFYGLDEGQLAVRDLHRVVDACRTIAGDVPVTVIADEWLGAAALFTAVLDERIDRVVAPSLGNLYADEPRRPLLSRILLHGDLVDAALATRARSLVLGGSPASAAWVPIDAACGDRCRRRADALSDEAITAAVVGGSRGR